MSLANSIYVEIEIWEGQREIEIDETYFGERTKRFQICLDLFEISFSEYKVDKTEYITIIRDN